MPLSRAASRGVAVLVSVLVFVGVKALRDGPPQIPTPRITAGTTTPPGPVEGPVVVAVGDLVCSAGQAAAAAGSAAECKSEETAALAKSLTPEAVLFPGDVQYDRGTTAEYAQVWSKSAWSSFKAITYAAVGNHEYSTPDAAPYFATFGARAGPPDRGWYRAEIGGWNVIALNSNCGPAGGCGVGSPQERWLRAELSSSKAECTLAFWHHPRWSSGFHGSDESIEPLWAALADGGADVAIAGHDHHYERFAPERGVRQFVAGTGGRSLYPTLGSERGSEVRNSNTFGVLELRLGVGEYSWKFHGIEGTTFTDAGRARCR